MRTIITKGSIAVKNNPFIVDDAKNASPTENMPRAKTAKI